MRLEALRAMLAADADDPFALYGLALELKVMGRSEDAEPLLRRLLEVEPTQLYGYYQLGEVLLSDGENEAAEEVLRRGVVQAEAAGDEKAHGELRALLDMC
jgi:tetratricopeptide (TPR) repeat protein